MGGIGSGRRLHTGARSTMDDFVRIDVRRWAREGLLNPGRQSIWTWMRGGQPSASITVLAEHEAVVVEYRYRSEARRYRIPVIRTPCYLGGSRPWFVCPSGTCGRHVAVLFGGRIFACRHCHNLVYPSSNESRRDRAIRRADKIRARLRWKPGVANAREGIPRGMHFKTFMRLLAEYDRAVAQVIAECDIGRGRR
jgi:hypothetical protein